MIEKNLGFDRNAFRDVRKEVLEYLQGFGKTNKGQKNIDGLKGYYSKRRKAA